MKLHEDAETFTELVATAATHIGLPEAYVEKDYWVTKALKYLSESEYSKDVVFKGGTSLSKAYRIIDRFSEDIDLAIFADNLSGGAKKRLLKNVEKTVAFDLSEIKKDKRISKGSNFRKTVYQYPRESDEENFGQASTELLIEVNSFTNPEPFETKDLQTFVADMLFEIGKEELIETYGLQSFPVRVLSVKRTLIEKILGVIKDSYNADPVARLSLRLRHLYDICLILKHEEHRDFVTSGDFSDLCNACIEDERLLFPKTAGLFDMPLVDAPIFSRFAEWRPSLEVTYLGVFKDLVYRDLPDMQDIEDTLSFIGKNIKRLKT